MTGLGGVVFIILKLSYEYQRLASTVVFIRLLGGISITIDSNYYQQYLHSIIGILQVMVVIYNPSLCLFGLYELLNAMRRNVCINNNNIMWSIGFVIISADGDEDLGRGGAFHIGSLQHSSTKTWPTFFVSLLNLKKPHQKFSLWRLNSSCRHGNGLFHGKIGGGSATKDITSTLLGAREDAPHIFRFISPTPFF